MNLQQLSHWTSVALCSLSLVAFSATESNAGVIPWMYDAIFGPVGSPYYAGYAPLGGGFYGARACGSCGPRLGRRAAFYGPAFYGPVTSYSVGCSTGRCSTGTCSTGDCSTSGCSTAYYVSPGGNLMLSSGSCATGSCGTTYSANYESLQPEPAKLGELQSVPAKKAPQTFSNEPATKPMTTEDDGFRPRQSGEEAPKETAPFETDAFKVPTPAAEEKTPELAPVPKKIEEGKDAGSDGVQIPTLNLDRKVAWRWTPTRERTTLRADFRTPRVARHVPPAPTNSGWEVVTPEQKLAAR